MLNISFKERVIQSMKTTDLYWDDSLKVYDIAMFEMLMERFDIERFLRTTHIDEYFYNKYFKDFVEIFDSSLHQKVVDDFVDYRNDNPLVFVGFHRDVIFEMMNDKDGVFHPYNKEKMIGVLNFLFDKVDIESVYKNTEISKDEYEKYLKDTVLKYRPNYHTELMDKYKEEENEN